MSAEAIGLYMPPVVTLADLAEMNAADQHGHRYETSPEGVLSVMPPADLEHARIAGRLVAWFVAAGWPVDHVLQAVGIRIPGDDRAGGRIPDVTLWRKLPDTGVWLAVRDLLVAVEIVSPGSETIDDVTKRREYASAGIPQYWIVGRDSAQTVAICRLTGDGTYAEPVRMPLAWLLQTSPDDHVPR